MAKPNLQQLLETAKAEPAAPLRAAKAPQVVSAPVPTPATVRQVHKPGDVNISAYFAKEVKSSLRLVQAKTGKNVKDCLAEALGDLFRKHNVPVPMALDELHS